MDRKKILILQRRPGIGDMCLFFPFINEICNEHANFEIVLLSAKRSQAHHILKKYYKIKKIDNYDTFRGFIGFLKLIFYLKKNNFRKLFIFHHGLRYFMAAKIAFISKIFFYGLKKNNSSIFEQAKTFTEKSINKKILNITTKIPYDRIEKNSSDEKIIFGIGGSGIDKKWNIDNFINLAQKIYLKKKIKIIIAGGPEEISDYNIIKKKLENFNLFSLCKLNISEAIKEICNSNFYIGNDTGFMHLSGCLGIRSFGLFGNTPTNYASYNKLIIPIIPENFETITHNSNAMNKITVNHVYNKIKDLI